MFHSDASLFNPEENTDEENKIIYSTLAKKYINRIVDINLNGDDTLDALKNRMESKKENDQSVTPEVFEKVEYELQKTTVYNYDLNAMKCATNPFPRQEENDRAWAKTCFSDMEYHLETIDEKQKEMNLIQTRIKSTKEEDAWVTPGMYKHLEFLRKNDEFESYNSYLVAKTNFKTL